MEPIAGVYRAIVDASPDGVLVTDGEGLTVYVNAQLEALSGYQADELVGRPAEILVPEDLRQGHAELRGAYLLSPRPRLMSDGPELRLRRRDGSECLVEIALAPARIEGRPMTVAAVRDATRRLALERDRTWLMTMLDLVPDAVVVTNATTLEVEYANEALTTLTGYTPEELVGGPISRALTRAMAAQSPAVDGDGPMGQELSSPFVDDLLHGRSGERIPVEMHQRLVTDADGSRHLVAVARDLRDRLSREEQLRASEEVFRTIFEQAPVGVSVFALKPDGARTIIMANEVLAEMFGCTVADLIGGNLDPFTFPEDLETVALEYSEVAVSADTRQAPLRRYRVDGATVWAEVRISAFSLPGVPGPLAIAYFVDVTERMAREVHREREAVLSACVADIAKAVLADSPEDQLLDLIATCSARLLHADGALVLLRRSGGESSVRLGAVVGAVLAPLADGRIDINEDVTLGSRLPVTATARPAPPAGVPEPLASSVGPIAMAPFSNRDPRSRGVLAVVRARGGAPFTEDEVDRLARFATQTRLAFRLAQTRVDQQRLALLEDRQRIARNLHDSVIQDIIAVGMQITAEVEGADHDDEARADRDLDRVTQLEEAVRRLRRIVFELRAGPERGPLDRVVRDLVAEAGRLLGHEPDLAFEGPVDFLPSAVTADVVSVLREALSNVARHAHATRTRIVISHGGDHVVLTVDDDGVGIPPSPGRGYGIANIEYRAIARDGSAHLSRGDGGGTRLVWSCPLPDLGSGDSEAVEPARDG